MAFQRPKPRDPVGEAGLFEYAVATLTRRMRTIRDLKRLMKPRAFPGDQGERDMDAVVQRLIDLKYLSDTRFAADFTRLRKENQGFGRRRVQQDLALKGIDKELVASTIASAFDETDEVELARRYAERKRMKPPADQKETARTMNRLLRAGYSSNAIFKLLRSWNLPETAVPEEGAGDSDSYAERDERAED
jgi:regulatory protein